MHTPSLQLIALTALCSALITHFAHVYYASPAQPAQSNTEQLAHIDTMLESINNNLLNINIQASGNDNHTVTNNTPLKQLIADVVTETVNKLPQNTSNTPTTPKPEYLPEPEQQARYDAAQLWINQQIQAGSFSMDALSDSHVTDGLPPAKVAQLVAGVLRRIKSGELQESDVFR